MSKATGSVFDGVQVDHVEFFVEDLAAKTDQLVEGYGFSVYATADERRDAAAVRSVALGKNSIRLVLTEALGEDHPATAYVGNHGDGVADMALRCGDATAAFETAVQRGARPVAPPAERDGVVTASIMGFGDVVHTFVQCRSGADERVLPGFRPVPEKASEVDSGLLEIDHFAVCLEAGQLDPTVEFYQQILDFSMIFEERIVVGAQAMNSKVVQSGSGHVTLTLIEPDVTRDPGQIDSFLKNHGGAGVQHIAFSARDIVGSVGLISSTGVQFLATPSTYYDLLTERLDLGRHTTDALRELNILVDEDHDGQLFQIFSKSTHSRNTLFFEVIERLGARTFGSGNIKALYEAVELQRSKDEAVR